VTRGVCFAYLQAHRRTARVLLLCGQAWIRSRR
jgi:hypothetical protein